LGLAFAQSSLPQSNSQRASKNGVPINLHRRQSFLC